jgi:hypothetical protein
LPAVQSACNCPLGPTPDQGVTSTPDHKDAPLSEFGADPSVPGCLIAFTGFYFHLPDVPAQVWAWGLHLRLLSRLSREHQFWESLVTRRQAASDFGSSFDLLNGFLEMATEVSNNPIQLEVVDHALDEVDWRISAPSGARKHPRYVSHAG